LADPLAALARISLDTLSGSHALLSSDPGAKSAIGLAA
jgi:hypothetical protein